MKGRQTGNQGAKGVKNRPVSHFMKAPVAAERLRAQYSEVAARTIALKEQQQARRGRSRRRFQFWAEVATRILQDASP
jgi:hypothetical protein